MTRYFFRLTSSLWLVIFLVQGLTARAALNVSITTPTNNTVLAAPAAFLLLASATDSGGSIYKVDFYSGTHLLGTQYRYPYELNLTNLAAGTYTYKAVVTSWHYNHYVTDTSSTVKVTVVTPVNIVLNQPSVTDTNVQLNFTANTGLKYVIESTTDFITWTGVSTNIATNSLCGVLCPQNYGDEYRFYRVRRLSP